MFSTERLAWLVVVVRLGFLLLLTVPVSGEEEMERHVHGGHGSCTGQCGRRFKREGRVMDWWEASSNLFTILEKPKFSGLRCAHRLCPGGREHREWVCLQPEMWI